jgi:hypothetical protein
MEISDSFYLSSPVYLLNTVLIQNGIFAVSYDLNNDISMFYTPIILTSFNALVQIQILLTLLE